MFTLRNFAFVLFAFLCSPSLLAAQSVLNFPRAISSSGVFTGIAVGNPTTTEVAVTFVAFQPDGTLLAGGQNPVTVTIPAGGQYARLIPEIFGPSAFNGWVQATSSTSGLTGFFINGNSVLTDLDGAGSRSPGTEFVLPHAVEDSMARTEVTLVNVNPGGAIVAVTLYASDGRVILAKDISLPGRNLSRQTLANIFGALDFSSASHLTLRANRPIVAHEVVADFQIPGTVLRRETGALSGHALTPATQHVLPQFATGGSWTSMVGLVNGNNAAQDVTLTAYKEDGSLWSVPSNPKRVTLAANGGLRETVENLFGFPSSTLNTGWILVSSSQGSLATYIGYGNTLTPSFAMVEGTEISTATRFSVFSQVAEGAGFYTGLTVVNPGPASADIEFYTLRADGSSVGRSTLTLAPNQKVARLFRELLPVSFQQVGGWGFVRATSPVVASVLFGSTNGYALASVPQQIPAGDFVPPAQTSGAITGTVRSGGNGITDIQVTLSGPVNTSITTESSGRFVFSQLPAGEYKVTASRTGAVIAPPERAVIIDRQNADGVDFDAGALTTANAPGIDFISPVSTLAGNSAVSIRVMGTNFTPASVVRVNNQLIPTTYVSSVELRAVIPASNLTQPTTLKIAVDTPPPGGGASSLFDFGVNSVPGNPLIVGSAPVGSFPAGVAIDTVRRHALITNEAGDSVTVLDLETRQTVAEVRVGRSPGEGIDIHPGKDIALVANVGSNDASVIDLKTNTVIQTIKVGRGPLGLAINPGTNRAYVVNGDDNNITVINLDTLSAIGLMSAGSRPSNIAVNSRTNQAIVSNRGGNSVSVISLATGASATINVGDTPRGVAINPDTNRGVVANAGSSSISILDLGAMTATSVSVGSGPTGVAIHQDTNSVLVTNSGVTRANSGLGGVSTVSIINLDTREEVASISAGTAAYGVGVDQARQIAAVANFGSNDVTIVRIPNPVPRISGVEPKTFPTGGGSFVVTVRGSGFVPTSVITLNGQPLPTVFVSTTELRGVVSAALVDQLLQIHSAATETGKGTISPIVQPIEFNIGVENPGPGGGNSPPPTDPQTTQIQPLNPVPSLLSLSPTETPAGLADLTLTLSGNNFNATSVVNFGAAQFSPVSSSLQSITIVVPKAQLVAGAFQVSVSNPAPGGGLSALLPFTVNAQANPGPTVLTVNPSSIQAGSGAATVVVQGAGFINSTTGTLAGVPGVLSGSTMSFPLAANETAVVGTLNGFISNPAPGGGIAAFTVNVLNPVPAVSAFTPSSAGVGAAATALQVTGTNFAANSQVTFGGTPIATAFVSSTQLTATITSALLTASGSFVIGVTNPAPGGGSSQGASFTVLSAPTLSSISPSSGMEGTLVNVTLSGTNFAPGSIIAVSGGGITLGQIVVGGGSVTLSTSFTINSGAVPGPRNVTVSTPGGTSNPVTFTVIPAPPSLASISPASGIQGATVGVTLTGTNFAAGFTVSINSSDVTVGPVTVASATSIATTFTISPTAAVGTFSVTVSTPFGTSGAVTFAVVGAGPTLVSISPASGLQGAVVGVTLTGTNFTNGSTVAVSGTGLTVGPVTVVSATSITTTFTISSTAPVGTRSVTVSTSSGTTGGVTFFVVSAGPTLVSINPPTGLQGDVVPVTLTGTNFLTGATVAVSGTGVAVTAVNVVNSTTLTATLTISSLAGSGARSVMVTTGVGTSGAVTFTVVPGVNLVTGFTTAANPSGVWSYGFTPTLGGTLSLYDNNAVDPTLPPGFQQWRFSNLGIDPGIARNNTGSDYIHTNNILFPANMLHVHPGPGGEYSVIRWTAPASGLYAIQGSFMGLNPQPTTTDVHVRLNSSADLFTTNLSSYNVPAPFSVIASVLAGDTIDFAAGFGTNLSYVADSTGVSGTIIPLPTVPAPSLTAISPGSGVAGTTTSITLTGTNFVSGGTIVAVSGAGVTVGAVSVVSSTSLTASLTIAPAAAAGARTVTVTTAGGTSNAQTFTVNPAAPMLTSVSPASGFDGTAVPVTLTGANFVVGATTVNISGTGVSVGTVTVASATSITTTFTIAAGTAAGAYNVTVTTAGGTSSSVPFSVVPTFSGSVFTGAVSTDWSNAANWQPAGVPTASTSVLVPAAAANQPTLTANAFVLNLTVQNGATLNTAGFTITAGGSVDAGTTITGTGTVIMSGTGTIKGTLPNVQVTGTATFVAASTSTINGNLSVVGSLDLVDATVTVTGNFSTTGSGALKMQNAAGVLTVNGATLFGGGDTTGLLTAGTLNAKGSFTSNNSSFTNFAASGTHLTVLNGTSIQTVSVSLPGSTINRFQNLQLSNAAGVVFSTNTQINGNFGVTVAAGVSGVGTVTIAGNLTTATGSAVTVASLTLGGTMTIGGTFAPGTITFVGTSQTIQAGLGYQNVVVAGTAAFASTTTVTGDLTVSSGSLDLAGTTVTVTGNFATTGSGALKMQNAAGVLTVNGATLFGGGDTTGLLTAGTLNAKGSFTSNNSSFTNFAASGTHLTVLNGTSIQTVSVSLPGSTINRFQNLQLSNAAGVVFSTNTQINGNFGVTVAAGVSGAGTVTIAGNLTTATGSAVTVASLTLGGTMTVGGTFTPTTTTFAGVGQSIQAGLGYQNVVVVGTVAFQTSPATIANGNLTVVGGLLDVSSATAIVTGNFSTTGAGRLKMQNSGFMQVNGNAIFDGGDTSGLLTTGTLSVRGNFTSTNSSFTNFAPSGIHLTVLSGSSAQTVSVALPGLTGNRFQDLIVNNTVGVSLASNVVVAGTLLNVPVNPREIIIGNGKTLTVTNIDVDGLDLDHVLLVINWNGFGALNFNNVDLRNYPDPATRITLTAASIVEFVFNGINFVDGVPTAGILVNATDTDGGGDFLLYISSNLNATAADARTIRNGGAFVYWSLPPANYLSPVNYNVGRFPRSVEKGDFNGDGRLDLAIANRNDNDVSILLGNGNGTFQTAVNYTTSTSQRVLTHPRFVKAGDFNLDGKVDLAVANENTSDISILMGNGDGTFQAPVNYTTDAGPASIAVGDFNGDGKPDLVVANGIADNFADTISILLGNGNGTFQPAVNQVAGSSPRSVVVVDLDGDGKQDVVVANGDDDNLGVYLGNGNGTFQAPVNYSTGVFPYSLVTSDFNHDGRPDLAVANRDDDNVSVYLGNGNGTLQAPVTYTTGSSPQGLTVGDFNSDGVADLATADCGFLCSQGSSGVSVLVGNGDGTFQFPVQFPAGTSPFAVVGGDFDNDGRLDLAVANRDSNDVSILIGTP